MTSADPEPPADPRPPPRRSTAASARVLPPAEPHSLEEIRRALGRPDLLVDLVLAAPRRLASDIASRANTGPVATLLAVASVAFAVPYGCVHGFGSWWRMVPLFLGTVAICFPSLHVFCSYLGLRVTLAQNLVLALTISAVAAIFSLGFAPILAFLRLTIDPGAHEVGWESLSVLLLAASLLAGIAQLWRCLRGWNGMATPRSFAIVLLFWHVMLIYIFARMGTVLGLW